MGENANKAPVLQGNTNNGYALRANIKIPDVFHTDAYKLAVQNGFEGSLEEWLCSLKGDKGDTGEQGIQGIQGIQGEKGNKGDPGYTPVRGTDYWTAEDKQEIVDEVGAVSYKEQELTEEQKAQARKNIGVDGGSGGLTVWKNLNFISVGDSIASGEGADKRYSHIVRDKLGMTLVNDSSAGGRVLTNYSSSASNPVSKDSALQAITGDNVKLILLEGGTNDFSRGVPMGEAFVVAEDGARTFNEDETVFKGALNKIVRYLQNKHPKARIVFLTPLHRAACRVISDLVKNSEGLYFEDYVQAIRDLGSYHSIDIVDLYATSGLNPHIEENAKLYFNPDGNDLQHPNTYGHMIIANEIIAFLERKYPLVDTESDEVRIYFSQFTYNENAIKSDGTLGVWRKWYTYNDHVDCSGYSKIRYQNVASYKDGNGLEINGISFYDANGVYISGIGVDDADQATDIHSNKNTNKRLAGVCDIPKNAKYAIFTYYNEIDDPSIGEIIPVAYLIP